MRIENNLNRGSYMSAHVLLNLLNEMGKEIKCEACRAFLSLYRNEFNKFNNTRARMLSPSYTVTIQAPIHHDFSRFETDGKIGMRRDGKKRNTSTNTCTMSHDAPTVSARFIYGPTANHDGSATIYHGGATNAHDSIRC